MEGDALGGWPLRPLINPPPLAKLSDPLCPGNPAGLPPMLEATPEAVCECGLPAVPAQRSFCR